MCLRTVFFPYPDGSNLTDSRQQRSDLSLFAARTYVKAQQQQVAEWHAEKLSALLLLFVHTGRSKYKLGWWLGAAVGVCVVQ